MCTPKENGVFRVRDASFIGFNFVTRLQVRMKEKNLREKNPECSLHMVTKAQMPPQKAPR